MRECYGQAVLINSFTILSVVRIFVRGVEADEPSSEIFVCADSASKSTSTSRSSVSMELHKEFQ